MVSCPFRISLSVGKSLEKALEMDKCWYNANIEVLLSVWLLFIAAFHVQYYNKKRKEDCNKVIFCGQQFPGILFPQWFIFLHKMKTGDFIFYGFQFLLFGLYCYEMHFCLSCKTAENGFLDLGSVSDSLHTLWKTLSPWKLKTENDWLSFSFGIHFHFLWNKFFTSFYFCILYLMQNVQT